MAGADIMSLDLPTIRDNLALEAGNTEDVRQRNLQRLMRAGYSVKQANFVAEWSMHNANYDVSTDERDVREASDNPFVPLDDVESGEMAVRGYSNAIPTQPEPRFLHPRMRNLTMARDPNAPAFEGGAGGEVAASPHLPATPNYPNPNDLAPKNRGYRGGNTPFMPPEGSSLGIVNPPPEMQERALTVEEVQRLRENNESLPAYGDTSKAPAGSQRDVSEQGRPVFAPSNLPGTPETATDNIASPSGLPEPPDVPSSNDPTVTQTNEDADQLSSVANEAIDAFEARQQSGNDQPEYKGNGESGTPERPSDSGKSG
jgi:hypothetical protein